MGYAVGKRFGHGREKGPLARVWSCARMKRTRAFLDRHGRKTVFLARFVGFFRALVPFAAGAVGMPYRPFLAYNLAGAVVWGSGTMLVGYFAGDAAINVAESASMYVALAAVAAVLVVPLGPPAIGACPSGPSRRVTIWPDVADDRLSSLPQGGRNPSLPE